MRAILKRRLERAEAAKAAKAMPDWASPNAPKILSEEGALLIKLEILGFTPDGIAAGARKDPRSSPLLRELTREKAAELIARRGAKTLAEAERLETIARKIIGAPPGFADAVSPAYRRLLRETSSAPQTSENFGRAGGAWR